MPLKAIKHLTIALFALGLTTSAARAALPAEPGKPSASMQGDQASWIADSHMHAFYNLTVAAFAKGPSGVDRPRFERESRLIFRDFAASRGISPDAMEDHLKLIPGQVIQIVTDDPKVLASYDNFVVAVFGPQ